MEEKLPTEKDVETAHGYYQYLTGMELRLTPDRQQVWYKFLGQFTTDDLELVVGSKQRKIQRGFGTIAGLKFGNLICHLDWFEEELAEVKAKRRAPRIPFNKASVLRASGRSDQHAAMVSDTVLSAKEVIDERMKLATMLKQWKEKEL